MAHIHTEPGQHDHTVSAYIVRLDGPVPRAVVHHHKKLRRYLQFGGHIELDEGPWQAVSHEILEESGFDMDQLALLQPPLRLESLPGTDLHPVPVCYNTHRIANDHFHTDVGWAFVAREAPRHRVGNDESADIRLVTRAELLDPAFAELDQSAREVFRFVLDVCLDSWEHTSTEPWG